ncbi:MAG: substrate-binding domain-containing protein, partial [Nocardioides sp.]
MRSIRLVTALALLAATLTGCGSSHGSGTRAVDHTLAIVGTSDIADSNLFAAVLKPGFEKAYPQYTVTYQGNATAQAMAFAKTGQFSALIVHAASLENQFVADGFSTEPYGRAIFWGDFVLLGPKNDPAGVMSGGTATADPAAAFAKIAAAGA